MANPASDIYGPCTCGSGKKYRFCCRESGRRRKSSETSPPPPRGYRTEPPPPPASAAFAGGGDIPPDVGRGAPFIHGTTDEVIFEVPLEGLREGSLDGMIRAFKRAIEKEPRRPGAWNNLAIARFLQGDVIRAIAHSERVIRKIDAENAFAWGNLVHFYLLVGRRHDAGEAIRRVKEVNAGSGSGLFKKCEALARVADHGAVLSLALSPDGGPLGPPLAFFAGTAAANLRRYEDARRYLGLAEEDPVNGTRARDYLGYLERRLAPPTLDGGWPYFGIEQWISPGILDRLRTDGQVRRWPGVVEGILCWLQDEQGETLAPLDLLEGMESAEAMDALRRIASGMFGSDAVRLRAAEILRGRGRLPDEPEFRIWQAGKWTKMRASSTEVAPEYVSRLPARLRPLMSELLCAAKAGALERAERTGWKLLSQAPEAPTVHNNLAAVLMQQGRREEAERLLRQAIEIDPTFLFARASLGRLLLQSGEVDEAREVLFQGKVPGQAHPEAMASYLRTVSECHVAAGELEEASRALLALEKIEELMVEKPPDEPTSDEDLRAGARLYCFVKEMERKKREEGRRRLLPEGIRLEESLRLYEPDELRAMNRALGIPMGRLRRKRALLRGILRHLGSAEGVRSSVERLPDEATSALECLRNAGGASPYEEFTKKFGSDLSDPLDWDETLPESALGRLKVMGLVVEGVYQGRESVVIPVDVRAALDTGAPASSQAAAPEDPRPIEASGGATTQVAR